MSRIDISFLQSSFYSFLHLFYFSLFNSHFDFFLLHFFRNAIFINCDRIHSSNLHSYLLSQLFVNFLVESNHGAKTVSVHMVVSSNCSAFQNHVTIQLHLFTSDTGSVCYSLSYSSITHRKSQNFFQSLALVSYSSVQNILSQFHEVSILSNKVSFALQSDDSTETFFYFYQNTTFRSLTVRTFCSNCLSFFADDLHCFVEIAFSISQRIFAVHHTSTGHFAELGYISHCYSHNIFYILK